MAYSVTDGLTELYSHDTARLKPGSEKHFLSKKLDNSVISKCRLKSQNYFIFPTLLNQSYGVRLMSRQGDRPSEYQKTSWNIWMANRYNQRLMIVFSTFLRNLISVFYCQITKEPFPHITKNRDITRWFHTDGVTLAAEWIIKRNYVPPVYPSNLFPINP